MKKTLILQSHSKPLPFPWIERCMHTVVSWSDKKGYEYLFINDALFDLLPEEILNKIQHQKMIAADLARLLCVNEYLDQDYEMVVWLDADFMIFIQTDLIFRSYLTQLGGKYGYRKINTRN